ncbi:polymeric immunoglobulin receptor-like isoform 2-T2 [Guaruba guarouba]
MELRALLLLLLCFPGFQAQIHSTEEKRSEGSSLYIQCPYTAETTQQQQKAWCRLRNGQCEPLVETKYSHTNWAAKGRVALKDNPTERTVSVTMTELQAEDSGTYCCTYYSYGYHPLRMISLFVFKELRKWELDSVSVQCLPSALSYSRGTKVWCRRDETLCRFVARTDYPSTQLNSKALEHRTLIQDDTQKRTVTITMQKLQAEDSGMYWCALYRRSHLTWLMEVRLSVSKRTKQYTAKESGDVSVQCPYSAPDYKAVSKAWCKEGARKSCTALVTTNNLEYQRTPQQGRVRIQDDTEQGIVTVTMERLQAQDAGVYWCALYERANLFRMLEVTLNVSEVLAETTLSGTAGTSQATPPANSPAPSSNGNTFTLLSGVLSILFLLALISLVTLYVRRCKQLNRTAACAAENITVVYGMEGDTISVNCTYNPWQQRWREKSWCKQIHETKCQHVLSWRPKCQRSPGLCRASPASLLKLISLSSISLLDYWFLSSWWLC